MTKQAGMTKRGQASVAMAVPRWYVVRTNPQCEGRAARAMEAAGFETYLPVLRRYVPHRRHKRMVHRDSPLLTGYVFVRLDANRSPFGRIRRCDGVKAFVPDVPGMAPEPLADSLVEALRDWVGAEWLRQDSDFRARRSFRRAGRKLLHEVTIASGDREGFAGRIIRRDNTVAQVLVQVFDRMEEVAVPVDDLLPVS